MVLGTERLGILVRSVRWNSDKKGLLSRLLTGQHSNPDGSQHESHSSLLSDKEHVYEIQTHSCHPGQMNAYLKYYESYVRMMEGKDFNTQLVGSWRNVVGNTDQCVSIWRHNDGYQTTDRIIRAFPNDPDLIKADVEGGKVIKKRISALLLNFSYWPEPEPRPGPSIYELRSYILKPGTMIEWGNNWVRGINYRMDHNQAVGGFFSQVGRLYMVFHLWAYESMEARKKIRDETWSKPGWDTNVTYTVPLIKRMRSRVMIPNSFSPLK